MNERNKERKNATLSPNRRIPKSDSYEKVRSSSGQGDIHKLRRQAGEGVKNWQNLAYVVYGWSHMGMSNYFYSAKICLD